MWCIQIFHSHKHLAIPSVHSQHRGHKTSPCPISLLQTPTSTPLCHPWCIQPLSLVPTGLWSLEYKQELTTPLCIAASHGHTACLRHLLLRRADPNLALGGHAPLHEACRGGHTDCVELLLEHKADPNLRSDEGLAPLHLCTTRGSLG